MNVGIREFRNGLSKRLADVRAGHTVTITDRGTAIARVVPVGRPTRLDTLIAEGRVHRAHHEKRPAPSPAASSGPVSDLVTDQRR